ncbi:MAG: hypothetical protein KBG15_10670 [Kofleriaceae bacterium]|nr:hypothetical protein [Kofleriaceae bacterium]
MSLGSAVVVAISAVVVAISAFVVASGLAVSTLAACVGCTAAPAPSLSPSPNGAGATRPFSSSATTAAPSLATNSIAPTIATADNHKPTAPINLALSAKPVANTADSYTVTLITTAQADLDAVVVTIDGQTHKLGTMRNRTVTTVSNTIELDGKLGRDIIGTAHLVVHGRTMRKAAALRLGAPAAPPPPAATVTLPDGTVVTEAR